MSEEQRPAEARGGPPQIATGMTLADISIRNHVFAWILMFALIGFGILLLHGLRHRRSRGSASARTPTSTSRSSTSRSPGRAPRPRSWRRTSSTSSRTRSPRSRASRRSPPPRARAPANITVEFELERDIDVGAAGRPDARSRRLQRRLPRGIDPPIVSKTNPEDQPIMRLALAGSRPPTFVADYIRNVIRPQLQTIPGVGEIQLSGFRDRNVRVWYDAVAARGAGPHRPGRQRARSQREHLEVPAGRIESAEREMNVRAEGEAIDVEALPQPGGHLPRRRPGAAARTWRWSRTGSRTAAASPARWASPRSASASRKLRGANAVAGRAATCGPRLAEIAQAAARGPVPRRQLRHHRLRRAGDQRDPVHAGPGGAAHRASCAGSSSAPGPRPSTCCSRSPPRSSAPSS